MMDARHLLPLTRGEALALLAGVSLGRVVFTHRALPAIRPVNHLMDDGQIIVRTQRDSALGLAVGAGPSVVAYEADVLDQEEHLGWSVIVVGQARLITDQAASARYRRTLRPWVTGSFDEIISISAEIVDGFRLVSEPALEGERLVP